MKIIRKKKKLLAMVFRHNLKVEGVKFLSYMGHPLQVGIIQHKKGKEVKPHKHPRQKYRVRKTMEFLHIEKGKIEVDIYDNDWNLVCTEILKKGDSMLYVDGGHGFRFGKNARVIEVKQGPYPGDKKAKIFKD